MKSKNSSLAPRSSRRSVLKNSLIGAAGLGAAGGVAALGALAVKNNLLGANAAHADVGGNVTGITQLQRTPIANTTTMNTTTANTTIASILNIAITAEELAVVFYSNVLHHAEQLGFSEAGFLDLKATLIEEQIHQIFLAQQGAVALTSRFSFPFGNQTFSNFNHFITVQQQMEALFVAAYMAAGKEFSTMGRPDLVQVAFQIGGVEAEHRAIGRAIGGMRPATNRAFETALLNTVADAPGVLMRGGFLNPRPGNSFTFNPVSTHMNGMSGLTMNSMDQS